MRLFSIQLTKPITLLKGRSADLLLVYLFLPIGIIFLVWGLFNINNTLQLVKHGEHTTGTIIELVQRGDSAPKPKVRFFVKESSEYVEFTAKNGTDLPIYKLGGNVPVVYEHQNPRHAMINTTFEIEGWYVANAIFGPVFIGLASLGIYKIVRENRKGRLKNFKT